MQATPHRDPAARRRLGLIALLALAALGGFAVAALLTNIFERKQEARNTYVRLVDVTEDTTDPAPWGTNFPRQYDAYLRTADTTHTQFGGSEAMPEQKLERDPWLARIFAGYAFSLDYRDRRGHAYMLHDQEETRRVKERPQTGACLHCHASVMPTYRRLGGGDAMAGFEAACKLSYGDAHAELEQTGSTNPVGGGANASTSHTEGGHPVSCVDCHAPDTMELRVTRPGFLRGIAALAASAEPVPHLPSVERWRGGSRSAPYDPNVDGTRQELRSFVCGQCHVEYYCGPKATLFFPWSKGLKVEQIEQTYEEFRFADGHRFFDWKHAETGAEVLKAQHPEFELWSQGVHARSGVSCADCHMPYTREGAMKVSDHWVRSPLLNVSRACQVCHPYPEDELLGRVTSIQQRTHDLMQRAASASVAMLDALKSAKAAGATDAQLAPAFELQRKAQWRLDFVAAENSMGFHAPAEAARILGEAIDYARQSELATHSIQR